jgi:hypothetical protein
MDDQQQFQQQGQGQGQGGQPPGGQGQGGYIPELGRVGSREYSEAHYKFLNEIIESKSARDFYVQIANTDFSHQCINSFFKILTSGFDKNAILARNNEQELKLRKIDFEIALNLMVLECHESDIQNPAFLTFRENIKQTFYDFISRSKDARERDQLLRQEYGQTINEQTNRPQQQQQGNVLSRFGRQQQ